MQKYDWIVIGSGSGLMFLEEALSRGLKCALIERGKFGGTCLTRGCIPTKILIYQADLIREIQHAGKTGLRVSQLRSDWNTVSQRVWYYIDLNKRLQRNLQQTEGLDVYLGTAEFTAAKTIVVPDEATGKTEPITAGNILIAAGARTRIHDIPGLKEAGFVTSERFFGEAFPKRRWPSLAIIGGGPIGLEFAHLFSAMGTDVSIIERAPALASTEEPEVSELLTRQMIADGITVHTGSKVTAIRKDGIDRVLDVQDAGGKISEVKARKILLAAGVQSNADLLKTANAGIDLDPRGYIKVDGFLRTNVPGVYAIGDINGIYQFRHKANYEAETLAANVFGPESERHEACYKSVPWAIFTHPQIAHVGLREAEVKALGKRYKVGVSRYSSTAKGYAMGYSRKDPDDGFVKLLADENMRILGAHIIGPEASILLQSFVYLMNAGYRCPDNPPQEDTRLSPVFPRICGGGTLEPLSRSMVIHPALSEVAAWVIDQMKWQEP